MHRRALVNTLTVMTMGRVLTRAKHQKRRTIAIKHEKCNNTTNYNNTDSVAETSAVNFLSQSRMGLPSNLTRKEHHGGKLGGKVENQKIKTVYTTGSKSKFFAFAVPRQYFILDMGAFLEHYCGTLCQLHRWRACQV